jgi:hypothetical protein
MDWYAHPQYVKDNKANLTEPEAVFYLREAWKQIYNSYPSDRALAILFAQTALETGRFKSIHNYNYGNIKKVHKPDDGYKFTMFSAGEMEKGKYVKYEPPAEPTHFRAYDSPLDGADQYIKFLSQRKRYLKAWQLLTAGDPKAYSFELYAAGYYTADPNSYTTTLMRLFDEFFRRKEELMCFVPPEKDETTEPESATVDPPLAASAPDDDATRAIAAADDKARVDNSIPPPPNYPEKPNSSNFIGLIFIAVSAVIASLLSYCGH